MEKQARAMCQAIIKGESNTVNKYLKEQSLTSWINTFVHVKTLVNHAFRNTGKDISVLQAASKYSNLSLIKDLVDAGADVQACNEKGLSAAFFALISEIDGYAKLQYYLEICPALAHAHDSDNQTLLHLATVLCKGDAMLLLLENGADVNAVSKIGVTPMLIAAKKGNVECLTILISHGADVNSPQASTYGRTPLFFAVENRHLNAAILLLENGADPHARADRDWPLLCSAVMSGGLDIISMLITHGVDVNARTNTGQTALFYATHHGDLDAITMLIRNKAEILEPCKDTPGLLHIAALKGYKTVVSFLIEQGAKINAQMKGDFTPLYGAVEAGRLDIASLLIQHGADANITDHDNRTPLLKCAELGHTDVLSLLIDNGSDVNHRDKSNFTAIYLAAENGHVGILSKLIANGADVNIRVADDWTALPRAIANKHVEASTLLINNGADVNAMASNGITPISVAAQCGDMTSLALLIQKGADVTVATPEGWSALLLAAQNGHLEIASKLIESGASINATNNYEMTPLFFSVHNKHMAVSLELIKVGAEVNARDNKGQSPLFLATVNNDVDSMSLLVEHGANVELKDKEEFTPVFLAAAHGKPEALSKLVKYGASVNAVDIYGQTPLLKAAQNNQTEAVKLLVGCDVIIDHQDNNGITALMMMSQRGNTEGMELLIGRGADANARGTHDNTPIFYAASAGQKDAVSLLLAKGVDINAKNKFGMNLLLAMVVEFATDHTKSVQFVNKMGIKPEQVTNPEELEKHMNAKKAMKLLKESRFSGECKNLDVIELLLNKGADVNATDGQGNSPLHIAAMYDRPRLMLLLLKHKANTNLRSSEGYTPIFSCVPNDSVNLISLLLNYGANVNAKSKDGETVLQLAMYMGRIKCIERLLQVPGILVKERTRDGTTALTAVFQDKQKTKFFTQAKKNETFLEALQLLVADPRCDVTCKNNKNKTLLMLAKESKRKDVIEFCQFVENNPRDVLEINKEHVRKEICVVMEMSTKSGLSMEKLKSKLEELEDEMRHVFKSVSESLQLTSETLWHEEEYNRNILDAKRLLTDLIRKAYRIRSFVERRTTLIKDGPAKAGFTEKDIIKAIRDTREQLSDCLRPEIHEECLLKESVLSATEVQQVAACNGNKDKVKKLLELLFYKSETSWASGFLWCLRQNSTDNKAAEIIEESLLPG